ncbi:hypothetical protein, variant 1 [Saprolegnia diclina VS20]|uniref:FHA domain-containing protein n=1 Tax=Saprolegnia diclina (strain VS20) TaxID=1156394 RepID=T0R755_SAPDV|nr:hypothetical protein, variant 1 [Saprolegnia diclina VS20]EQC27878.1 hypothetical protein, variant 1 [Saprolegnia diclina VS20]|eukprot:XP_008618644.1 hypothetical protein, variant 1 [Saprolegnia diclina VS20]
MRVLYLDPIAFPPAALDDATTLQLRRYLLGSSLLTISGCFFVEAFTLATEQERLELAACADRWVFFDPSGDTVKVSAVPGDSVFVNGTYLRDGEERSLVNGSRITLALTASLEISYDFFESPRAVTSPVESTRSNPETALDTETADVNVQAAEEPPVPDVPTPGTERLQVATPAPIEVATPTLAVPQEHTAPAPTQVVSLAKHPSLPTTSTASAFQNTRFPDPAPLSAPDELPDLFDGGDSNDDNDHDDDQQEAQLAPVADDPPRSHRMPGLFRPVTASEPFLWVPQTFSVPKQRPDAPRHNRKVASRTRSALDLPTSPPRRSKAPRSTSSRGTRSTSAVDGLTSPQRTLTVASRTRFASGLDPPTTPPARTRQHLARRASTPVPQSPPIPFLCTEKRCHTIATVQDAERKWKCNAHGPTPTPTPTPTPFTVLDSVFV